MADTSRGGGILGRILLPGYTDAGPDSSFQPVRVAAGGASKQDDDDMISEAATEIHDNRTTAQRKQQHDRRRQQQNQPQHAPPRPSPRPNYSGGENYGFFPSTKPIASPRPKSPPNLTRRQASTSSMAGTSTVPETGACSQEELENQERFQYWKEEGNEKAGDKGIMTLSKEALDAMDEKQRAASGADDALGRDFRQASLIENDDAASFVSSTGSEMGTVINVGSDRFAEIEAMAAMVEANPEFLEVHDEGDEEVPVNQLPDKASLSLPILEAKSFNEPTVFPHSKLSPRNAIAQDLGLKMKTTAETNDTGTTTPSINHQQYTNNPSTSAMVSAAIRRIGSGITSKTMSAPPTPKTPGVPVPRVEDLLKSTLTPKRKPRDGEHQGVKRAPLSFALRSPGSSARYSLHKERTPLTPDFSRTPQSDHARWQNTQPKAPISPSIMLPGLKFAQKCFSADQTLDEYPFPVADDGNGEDILRELPRSHRYNLSYRPMQQSQSWDVGHGKHSDAAFRARTNAFGTFRRTASHDDQSLLREKMNSDNFSPTKFSKAPALELQNSQRIETEREDALDILACLVERGAEQQQDHAVADPDDSETSIAEVSAALQEVRKAPDEVQETFSIRVGILEELLRSHAYAVEMKRAAHSASTWLKSIGRSTTAVSSNTDGTIVDAQQASFKGDKSDGDSSEATDGALKMEMATLKAMLHSSQMELKEKSEVNQKLDMELSKCRAEIGRLRSASRSEVRTFNGGPVFFSLPCLFSHFLLLLTAIALSYKPIDTGWEPQRGLIPVKIKERHSKR